jgi:hypothetical protein
MRALIMLTMCAALASAGCHMGLAGLVMGASGANGPYQAGAISADLGPAAVRTLACLDLGLAVSGYGADALLEMHIGNRCVHAEPLDLERLVIRGKDAAGVERRVYLVDPRNEIVRAHVGALERGHERIRLRSLDQLAELCFEVDAVAPDAPDARPLPLCLDWHVDGWRARSTT